MAQRVRSRERPAKPTLSRAKIISATIEIVRTEGLHRVTMRRVAQALDTGPASLYVYVANTAELHAAVLEELIGSLPMPPPAIEDWKSDLHALLGAFSDLLLTYPGLARSALVLRPTGPNAVALIDRIFGLLLNGDVPVDRAALGTDLLMQRVIANAAEHSAPTPADIDAPADVEAAMSALESALRGADPRTAPHVAAHAETLLAGGPTERDRWAIDALIAGIASTPTSKGTP